MKSRTDNYLNYLNTLNEVDFNNLPIPISRSDIYLYELCLKAGATPPGGSGTSCNCPELTLTGELKPDELNDGIGYYVFNSKTNKKEYKRLMLNKIPTISKTIKDVNVINGELQIKKTNNSIISNKLMFLTDISQNSNGGIDFIFSDGRIFNLTGVDLNLTKIRDSINPIRNFFIKDLDGNLIEISEEEFNNI